MTVRIITVEVRIEDKEEQTPEGVAPGIPTPDALCSHMSDYLADQTKHDALLGYRVLQVTPA